MLDIRLKPEKLQTTNSYKLRGMAGRKWRGMIDASITRSASTPMTRVSGLTTVSGSRIGGSLLRQSLAPRTQNSERNGNNQDHDQDRCFQQSTALVGRDAENFFDEIHMDLCFA